MHIAVFAGTMCAQIAAFAPEFFLLHGYVDKLWSDWQALNPSNVDSIGATGNPNAAMIGTVRIPVCA
jgi:hypothetical protein